MHHILMFHAQQQYGEERNKNFPADRKMMEWLKSHEEVREKIWKMMNHSA